MNLSENMHYSYLQKSYDKVGECTWKNNDFSEASINISRSYYNDESLLLREPVPKKLEVYALLSGLPFSKKITEKLVSVQEQISKILGNSLHYWVKNNNFGLEYCVFKWPDDNFDESRVALIKKELSFIRNKPFLFTIYGIQVNQDGCIVARGYDENRSVFNIRDYCKKKLDFISEKQSNWAHIPIGRILEPIGTSKFIELKSLIDKYNKFIVSDEISSMKFIHETRWYMEKKSVLSKYQLI